MRGYLDLEYERQGAIRNGSEMRRREHHDNQLEADRNHE